MSNNLISELQKKWGLTSLDDLATYDITSSLDNYASKGYSDKSAMYADFVNDKNAYLQSQIANENKSNAIALADEIKKNAIESAKDTEATKLQYADTRRQLMEKYIPETLLAQGVANTGYTADALLKAENLYNKYAHNAMSERAASEKSALSNYDLSSNNALSDYNKAYNEILMERNAQAYQNFLDAEKRKAAEEEKVDKEKSDKEAEDAVYRETVLTLYDNYIKAGYDPKKDATTIKNNIITQLEYLLGNDENKEQFIAEAMTMLDKLMGTTPSNESNNNPSNGNSTTTTYVFDEDMAMDFHWTADPNMKSFNFDGKRDVKSGKIWYDGKNYKVKTEEGPVPEEEANAIRSAMSGIFANGSEDPGVVFLYKGYIYITSTETYSNGSKQIYRIRDDKKKGDNLLAAFLAAAREQSQ